MKEQSRRDCIWVERKAPHSHRSPVGTGLISLSIRILSLTGQVLKWLTVTTHIQSLTGLSSNSTILN